MAMTVTATQGGSTANGMILRVYVITGAKAAASQTGGSFNLNNPSNTNTWSASITTTAGSNVYGGASMSGSGNSPTTVSSTSVDTFSDATNAETYCTWKSLNVTTGATSRGLTASPASAGFTGAFEILALTTLTEDASAPALASTTSATTVTTASFTPAGNALLVAVVVSDGGASATTMTVSGGGLSWSQKTSNPNAGNDYAGIWIADGPAGVTPAPVLIRGPVQYLKPPQSPASQVIGAPPPAAFTGAATLSGSGTLTNTAVGLGIDMTGSGTLSASPSQGGGTPVIPAVIQAPAQYLKPQQGPPSQILGAAPIITISSGATLSGSGTLGAAPYLASTAAMSGTGTLSASPVLAETATLSGSGTLSASPALQETAALSGSGTLSNVSVGLGIDMTGQGTLNAFLGAGVANLTGSGTLSASPAFTPSLTMTGTGTLSAQGAATATLTGLGTLKAVTALGIQAAMTGLGTLGTIPPFAVARSTSSVTDPRDGSPSVTAIATSAPSVS